MSSHLPKSLFRPRLDPAWPQTTTPLADPTPVEAEALDPSGGPRIAITAGGEFSFFIRNHAKAPTRCSATTRRPCARAAKAGRQPALASSPRPLLSATDAPPTRRPATQGPPPLPAPTTSASPKGRAMPPAPAPPTRRRRPLRRRAARREPVPLPAGEQRARPPAPLRRQRLRPPKRAKRAARTKKAPGQAEAHLRYPFSSFLPALCRAGKPRRRRARRRRAPSR